MGLQMNEIFHTVFKYKEKKSPDKLGLYPERVHVDAMPERRYLWTARIFVILSCLSICLSMMFASGIYLLLPQRGARPLLLQVNKYFSVLEPIQPTEKNVPAMNLIAERYIEEYVAQRHIITDDIDELMYRWGKGSTIYWLSTSSVYHAFAGRDFFFFLFCFFFQAEDGIRDNER